MKHVLLFALALLGLLSFRPAQAQTNALKINLISPVVRTLSLSFEHKLNDSHSFQLQASYTGFKDGGEGLRAFSIAPEYRIYLSEQPAPQGFYVAPFMRYQHLTTTHYADLYYPYGGYGQSEKTNTDIVGAGLLLGRQWVLKQRVTIDLFVGPAYNASGATGGDLINFNEMLPIVTNGFSLRGGVTLGVVL